MFFESISNSVTFVLYINYQLLCQLIEESRSFGHSLSVNSWAELVVTLTSSRLDLFTYHSKGFFMLFATVLLNGWEVVFRHQVIGSKYFLYVLSDRRFGYLSDSGWWILSTYRLDAPTWGDQGTLGSENVGCGILEYRSAHGLLIRND